ncbi:MAG: flagellar biosynthetic protein FliR [Thermoguttaceae bacterium]
MDWLEHLDAQKFLLFTLVLTRVSGLCVTAPIYGTQQVPTQIRALVAFALALLVTPTQWGAALPYPGSLVEWLVLVGGELLVGMSLGIGIVVLLSGIGLTGQMVGQASGLQAAEVLDPSQGDNVSVFSQLFSMLATAVFVLIGGHRILMAALLDTFQFIPPGGMTLPIPLAEKFVTLVSLSFSLGVRAAGPVVASLLVAHLVLGLIGRTVPQLNILVIGFGMNILLALGVLTLSLGAAVWLFQEQIEPVVENMVRMLKTVTG